MKNTIVSILLIVAILFSLSACKKTDSESQTQAGETESTSSASPDGFENVLDALEDFSQTNPDGTPAVLPDGSIDSGFNNSENETMPMPKPIPDGKPIKVELDKNGFPKKPLYAPYVNKFISDAVYKLDCVYSTNEDAVNISMPFTLAVKGAKTFIAMDMTLIAGANMPTHIITNGKKSYIVFPSLGQYITSSPDENESMLGDVSNLIDTDSGKYISTTEVKFKNKNYICETYKESGMTVKCYFLNGKTLDRQEIISPEGTVILSDMKYSNDVEDELFELPEGYNNIDNLAGLLS